MPPAPGADDAPESLGVPRMDPPPSSLEAMMHSARSSGEPERISVWRWLGLLLVVVAAAALTGYVMR